jgi:predicted HicB family RNase H-like nuclease
LIEVHSRVAIMADELGTSINNFIKEAIEKEIEFAH